MIFLGLGRGNIEQVMRVRLAFPHLQYRLDAGGAQFAMHPYGIVTLTQMNEICRRNPRSSSHNFEPFSECLGAGLAESLAGDEMALQIEMVVDGIVNRQKSLH